MPRKINTSIKTKAELRASLQGLANLMNKYNATYTGDQSIIAESIEESVRDSLGGVFDKKPKKDGGYVTIRKGDLFNTLFKQNDKGDWVLNTTQQNSKEKQAFNKALDEHLKKITNPKKKEAMDAILNTIKNTPSVTEMIKTVEKDLKEGYGYGDDYEKNKSVWKAKNQTEFVKSELEKNPDANKKDLKALFKKERIEGVQREMMNRAEYAITASYRQEDIDNMFSDMSEVLEGVDNSSINKELKDLLWHKGRSLTSEDIARLEAAWASWGFKD